MWQKGHVSLNLGTQGPDPPKKRNPAGAVYRDISHVFCFCCIKILGLACLKGEKKATKGCLRKGAIIESVSEVPHILRLHFKGPVQ